MNYELNQNYPNPFNSQTTIEFSIPQNHSVSPLSERGDKGGLVTLKVYNVLGREVATLVSDNLSAGIHQVKWNASNLASGVYLYRLKAGTFIANKRMVLLK